MRAYNLGLPILLAIQLPSSLAWPSPLKLSSADDVQPKPLNRRIATNMTSSTASSFPEPVQLNATSVGSPADGGLVRWDDWAFGGKNYRDPRATIGDGRHFAITMLNMVEANFESSGADKRDHFPGGDTFVFARQGSEQRYNLRFRLRSSSPDQDTLSWEEVIQAAYGFYRWTEDWNDGSIPSCDLILVDHWQFMGVQVAGGAFTVSPIVVTEVKTT